MRYFMKMKQTSFEDFRKENVGKHVRHELPSEDPDFTLEDYFDGKHKDRFEKTEEYVQEKTEIPTYNGEWKYVNCSIQKIKRLLETETATEEIKLLEFALSCKKKGGCTAGEPYRGEKRRVKRVESIKELL